MKTFGFDDGPTKLPFEKQPLLIELVPAPQWEINLRTQLPKRQWDRLRRAQYKRANYRCEICGETGIEQGCEWPVECHEVWSYDDKNHVQKLERLIALCPGCHAVKHAGRTINLGRQDEVVDRLMKVNGWTPRQATAHISAAFQQFEDRSQSQWALDISAILPRSSTPSQE